MSANLSARAAGPLRSARPSTVRSILCLRSRSFATPSQDIGPKKTHTTDKPDADAKANVQSDASKSGHKDRDLGSGASQATSRRDERNNNKRAEQEHPEAPKPVIGMNEERGTKGH